MKKRRGSLIALLSLSGILLSISSLTLAENSQQKTQKISVCIDDWPPHINRDGNNNHGPLMVAVSRTFNLAGHEVLPVWAPWQRCMENVELGIWDASPGWSKTPVRERHLLFSSPLTSSYHLFMFRKKTQFDWNEWQDLKGLTIGVTSGYNYGKAFDKHLNEKLFKPKTAESDAANVKKLVNGELDLFVVNKNTAWSIANKYLSAEDVSQLALHPKPVSDNRPSHVIFSKSDKGKLLMQDFNEAAEQMKQNGEFSKLFDYLRH